jgi:hypothetical protein
LPCESVHYRISAANQRSVCPPQCIRRVPQPVPSGRRDTFDLPPSMKAALCPLDCCGFSGVRAVLRAPRNRLGGAQGRIGADQCDHRRAGTASVVNADRGATEQQRSAFRKRLARYEPPRLMERPAICCVKMRLTRSSRACRACRCPRGICATARHCRRSRNSSHG